MSGSSFESLAPGRVLIVDDEESVADLFREFLVGLGHEVEACATGRAALEAFDRFQPDAVLTDLNLDREMSGFDVMKAVKERNEHIPIIVVTGFASVDTAIQALRDGAYDYIVKPCNLEELDKLLGRALESKRLAETNRNLMAELTAKNEVLERHELELREKVRLATWQMTTLFEMSKEIGADLSLEFRSGRVCEKARVLTGGQRAVLFLRSEEGEDYRLWARSGVPAIAGIEPQAGSEGPLFVEGEGLNGLVVLQQTALRRSGRSFYVELQMPELVAGDPESLLVVPLVAEGRVIGALDVLGKPGGFSQDDEDFLSLFASSAAILISNALLYEKTLELDRLKSEFVAVVSHEIRTPLASIRGSLELLADERYWEIQPQQVKFLRMAQANSDRLLRLINDILDFSKLESSSLPMTKSINQIGMVIGDVVENLRTLFEERGVRLTLSVPDDMPPAEFDEHRIAQVVTNLISNAIKFSPTDGSIEVSIEHDGVVARVAVRDHGEGIAPRDLSRLFKKFSQVDSSSTRKAGGTGLGLVICKGIVEAHGGTIGVDSHLGEGSTFTFTLPLCVDPARTA